MTGHFTGRLKAALTGNPDTELVFLGNFEVEDQWARGEPGLPRLTFGSGSVIVNRMDEFALLLAGKGDHVVLKGEPDPDYLSHLEELGFDLPGLLVVEHQDPGSTVTQDALEDRPVLRELGRIGARAGVVCAHGVSELEERLAERAGIALAAPPAAICKAVNSKIYSRRLAASWASGRPAAGPARAWPSSTRRSRPPARCSPTAAGSCSRTPSASPARASRWSRKNAAWTGCTA